MTIQRTKYLRLHSLHLAKSHEGFRQAVSYGFAWQAGTVEIW